MERKTVILFALIPVLFVCVIIAISHTSLWPDFFARRTDTFIPQGPTIVFNDITPSDRTKPIEMYEGFAVRPITASPVYLLFQPRQHSNYVRVEVIGSGNGELLVGGRSGTGPESNFFVQTHMSAFDSVWNVWNARIPFENMASERIDARRIVFQFNGKEPLAIRSVRIYYED